MRTTQLYWFLRFADKKIKKEGNISYVELQNAYRSKKDNEKEWPEKKVRKMWDTGIDIGLWRVEGDKVEILHKGDEWLEGKYILYGLIRELWNKHKFLITLAGFIIGALSSPLWHRIWHL